MISICSTCYRETDTLEIFVRSIIGNATKPDDLEIIIVNDEGYLPTQEKLFELEKEFKQLQHITFPRKKRIRFFEKVIDFYDGSKIFDSEVIKSMRKQISDYSEGIISRLWYPAGGRFNMACKYAKGDYMIICPSDYLVMTDVSLLEHHVNNLKDEHKALHFDWYDFTSLEPYPDVLEQLRKEKDIRGLTKGWMEQAMKNNIAMIHMQHGTRIINSSLYPLTRGFDDRWFIRALHEDLFNLSAKVYAPGPYRIMDYGAMGITYPFMGPIRGQQHPLNYLTPLYDGGVEKHDVFKADIRHYLETGVGKYAD
jgi:glycosyltransferase involved in cell wall biosynthesis